MMSTPFWPSTLLRRVCAATTPSRPRGLATELVPDMKGLLKVRRDAPPRDAWMTSSRTTIAPRTGRRNAAGSLKRRLPELGEELGRVLAHRGRHASHGRAHAVREPRQREQRGLLAAGEAVRGHHAALG